ncbi:MAG: TonB-dependent receptor [Zymomonas mobilis subsp. pomaceae]|uniref:TonB-dependent receptor n=1 Tax=Zymomonas mobilis subsp. pomaceae (strain ATCC 29192 / DSM 22645 / JCM 10191 / CCUG 17912 / NBRC 13757 / NCIMB 11200 / NRRL B-4491 / Barker I) TaxID=579138 RepID=F8EW55_ZYMMT|nr:TonB-dependent receptor [Zymomonas mobilis]AEI38465.1 TonB-dependent receptor [Zymomonas mobilis subsp. pomaceae ATCC 29192]MDX5948154.1 TonB-dependent receptor [Zymomonas mobilis subsp. pomaceae]GEB89735.1 TonB-dependent receptor [Zymomonas mobilis subsp. pomaceae]
MIRRHLKSAFMTTGMVAGVIAWTTPLFAQEISPQDTAVGNPSQADIPATTTSTNDTSGNAAVDKGTTATAVPPSEAIALPPAESISAVPSDAITVTGSRLPPGVTSTSPITSVNAKEITKQGYNRIEDLLNRMPQFYGGQNSATANGSTGTATANLRNLGSQRTLVLINGRRLMPGDPSAQSSDLNAIPASLIKRVDVLTGGASAVYGSDAVAGVVNFIMDTDYEGFHADAQYNILNNGNDNKTMRRILGNANENIPRNTAFDGWGFNANLKFGAGTKDGRGHVVAYLGYRRQAAVVGADRDYSACSINGSGASDAICGGSSTSAAGTALVGNDRYHFSNGQLLPKSSTYNYGAPSNIQRPDQRYTAGFFAHYDVTDGFKPYAEFQFMDDRSTAQIAPSGTFGYGNVSCDNPFLTSQASSILCSTGNTVSAVDSQGQPYSTSTAQIYKRNVEGGPRLSAMQHTSYRGVIGSKGEIVKGLTYDVYGQYGSTVYQNRSTNDFSIRKLNNAMNVTNYNGVATCRSVIDGSDSACVPYDIFSGKGASQTSINYLNTPALETGSTQETVVSGSLTFDGSQYGVQLPTASHGLSVSVGAEYRREKMKDYTDEELSSGDLASTGGPRLSSQGQYDVKELFIEAGLPIMDHKRGVNELSLNGGFRYSDYSSSGSVMSYKGQMVYSPVRGVALRGGYNRAVRAPSIQELYSPTSVALDGSTDPCAGPAADLSMTAAQCSRLGVSPSQYGTITDNTASQYNGLTGGNPNLKPETANTFTGGIALTPFRRFNFTADFFDIKIKNIINQLGADNILQLCGLKGLYCDRIHRDENGSLWRSQNGYVSDTLMNVGSLSTRGVDFGVNYSYPLGSKYGNLSASMNGTWLLNYKTNPGGGATTYNCAGLFGAVCGMPMPKWRHQVRVSWDLPKGYGFSAMWRFVGAVKSDVGTSANPAGTATSSFDRKIGNVSYLDLTAYYKVTDKVTLSAGVNNVLDTDPPLITSQNGSGAIYNGNTYASTYDVYGRYIFAGLSYDF